MKRAFLLIVLPAVLVALGFAQTPAASININTDQTNIKGCLGGSDGNYTVVEDNTGHSFKITTSSVDLKPHLSHEVTLIGHRASGASSAAADNSFAVTELNMISEHCAAAAAASTATVSTPLETASIPIAAAAAPAAMVTTPAETAAAPAAIVPAPAETTSTPAAAAAAPAAIVTPPAETVVTPAAEVAPPAETAVTPAATATPPAETAAIPAAEAAAPAAMVSMPAETSGTPAARPRRRSETPAAATTKPAVIASPSSEPVSTPVAASTTPAATASTSSESATTPAAVATTPTATSRGWSLWLLIAFGVLVLVIGTMFPFLSRWRKRKNLERADAPNLSFTRDASSDQGKSDEEETRKAA
jgi:hypothetical protein